MLTIRLSRIGKKNKPMYRLIVSEKARDPYGRALEILGSYNPYTKELAVKAERIKHWLSFGAGMSVTVNNLLIEKGIIKEGKKLKATKVNKKKKKAKEKKKKKEASKEPKEEAKKEAKEEVKDLKEAPAEPKEKEVKKEEEVKEEVKKEEKPEDKIPGKEEKSEEKKK